MEQSSLIPTGDEAQAIPSAGGSSGASPAIESSILRNRNFVLLWVAEAISVMGDQFHLIAMPWLVLVLTGNALAVGAVMALAAIPRAIFMLVGGAATDRLSPRTVMILSNSLRFLLVGSLGLIVLAGQIELWMLYGFALAFGLADAFFFPAQSAIVPQLVEEEQLGSANAVVQGTAQVSMLLGPILAGGLIALLGRSGGTAPGVQGIGAAFLIDSVTFLLSASLIALIQVYHNPTASDERESVLENIRVGLAYAWADPTLRMLFLIVAAVAGLINGVMAVGIPVLADARLAYGAASFGIVMSAMGAGSLVGMGISIVLPRPDGYLGTLLLAATALMGLGLILLGLTTSTLLAALIALMMGIGNGYINIELITWLQRRAPEEMLGRMMSLFMFSSVGLMPVMAALAGAILEVTITGLFVGGGALLWVVVLIALRNPDLRALALPQDGYNADSELPEANTRPRD